MRPLVLLALAALAAPLCADTLTAPDYRASLIRFEGVKTTPYKEKDGSWSVGIGHNLSAHSQQVKPSYTRDEISDFFDRDLAAATRAARALIQGFDDLPDAAKDVAINIIWGVGPTGFQSFRNLRLALSKRAYLAATVELVDSRWAKQVSKDRLDWAVKRLQSL